MVPPETPEVATVLTELKQALDQKWRQWLVGLLDLWLVVVLLVGGLIGLGLWAWPHYQVYAVRLQGEAQLQRAEYTSRIRVLEAQAVLDSARLLAEAEQLRAAGSRLALESLGDRLSQHPEYVQYLQTLANSPKWTPLPKPD
jgi:hypothetical protein